VTLSTPSQVEEGEIDDAVTIEVAQRDRPRIVALNGALRGLEGAVALAQDAQRVAGSGTVVEDYDKVENLVAVQVAHGHKDADVAGIVGIFFSVLSVCFCSML
jgi:hypothetical protein